MELANFEIWEKWLMLLSCFLISGVVVWKMDITDNKDDFLDVPDFIKGKDSDFYGN